MDSNIDNKMLNKIATQILLTEKPATSLSTKRMIRAFTMSKNRPNVRMVIGRVRITNIGFTNKFKTDNTMATNMAVTNLSPDNSTPGNT